MLSSRVRYPPFLQRLIFAAKLCGLSAVAVALEQRLRCDWRNLSAELFCLLDERKSWMSWRQNVMVSTAKCLKLSFFLICSQFSEKLSTRSSIVFPLDVTNFEQVAECCKKVKMFFGKVGHTVFFFLWNGNRLAIHVTGFRLMWSSYAAVSLNVLSG